MNRRTFLRLAAFGSGTTVLANGNNTRSVSGVGGGGQPRDAVLVSQQSPVALGPSSVISESELLPLDADEFRTWPTQWQNESRGEVNLLGGTDRNSGGEAYSPYLVLEAESGSATVAISSPVVAVNSAKRHVFVVQAKTLSGSLSLDVVLRCLTNGSQGNGLVTLLTGLRPGSTFRKHQVFVAEAGGPAPAFVPGTDRAQILLQSSGSGAVGVQAVHLAEESRLAIPPGYGFDSGGIHEALYDGEHVYLADHYAGTIAKMSRRGEYLGHLPSGGWAGILDAHQLITIGSDLYAITFIGRTVRKFRKSDGADVSRVDLPDNGLGVVSDGTNLWATTSNGQLHKVPLRTFSLEKSYNILPVTYTQATPLFVAGSIWLHSTEDGRVFRVSPADGSVQAVIDPPPNLASIRNYGFGTDGSYLYLSFKNGVLVAYSPESNRIAQQWSINFGADSQVKTDDRGHLWMAMRDYRQLVRFDPRTGSVLRLPIRRGGKWCEVVGNEVWVGGLDDPRIMRYSR